MVVGTGIAALWFAGAMSAYGDMPEDPALYELPANWIISDQITVIDGDTFIAGGTRIRLHGIDAPEIEQQCTDAKGELWPCGLVAKDKLADWLDGATVGCAPVGLSYDRTVAVCRAVASCSAPEWCHLEIGSEVARYMVREGYALDWPKYSGGAYSEQQDEASSDRRGIWAGAFVEPWSYRDGERLS